MSLVFWHHQILSYLWLVLFIYIYIKGHLPPSYRLLNENKSCKENSPDFGTTLGNTPLHSCCLLANTSKKSTFTLKSEEANHINRNCEFQPKNFFLTRVTAIHMTRLIKISENWKKTAGWSLRVSPGWDVQLHFSLWKGKLTLHHESNKHSGITGQ